MRPPARPGSAPHLHDARQGFELLKKLCLGIGGGGVLGLGAQAGEESRAQNQTEWCFMVFWLVHRREGGGVLHGTHRCILRRRGRIEVDDILARLGVAPSRSRARRSTVLGSCRAWRDASSLRAVSVSAATFWSSSSFSSRIRWFSSMTGRVLTGAMPRIAASTTRLRGRRA